MADPPAPAAAERRAACRNCGRPAGPLLLTFIYGRLMGLSVGVVVSIAIWRV